MRNQTENSRRNTIIFYSMLLMAASVFISRAALSVSIIIFCSVATLHPQISSQLKNFARERFLLLLSFLCWLPLISGLWSSDVQQWWNVVQLKLPFVFLPIAFSGNWKFSQSQWRLLAVVFISLVLLACLWSFIGYASTMPEVHENYLKAKLIQTPLENDHVRFSWLVAVAIMLCFLMMHISPFGLKWLWLSFAVIMGVYLHLLAARMGLVALYIFLVVYVIGFFKKSSGKFYRPAILALVLLPLLAWLLLPTFRNRISYMQYDLRQVSENKFLEGSNDGARFFSMAAGWHILKEHPFGVGAGDVPAASDKWFAAHYPEVKQEYRLTPMNEWLMYGAFAGWIGVVFFSMIMMYPFFIQTSHAVFWLSLLLTIFVGAMIDMFFEVQYGIFLSAFVLLWWYKWLKSTA